MLHHVGVLHFEDDTIVPRLILPYDFWDTHRLPYTPNVYLGPVEEITAMHALDITAMHALDITAMHALDITAMHALDITAMHVVHA